jgi:hypothetical protein
MNHMLAMQRRQRIRRRRADPHHLFDRQRQSINLGK